MSTETLEQMLIRHEGLRLKPYRCTSNKLTIGCGRNLEDNGITEEEAMVLLHNDIKTAEAALDRVLACDTSKIDSVRWDALTDMVFNLGETRFRQFRGLIAAVKAGDWDAAAQAMVNSKWATQVGVRATELVSMMRTGKPWTEDKVA